jgi:hypothetical protein
MNTPSPAVLQQTFEQAVNMLRRSLGRMSAGILEALAAPFECEWATYWHADPRAGTLRAAISWTKRGVHPLGLEKHTSGRQLSLSEGVAGQVWRGRHPVWTTDLVGDMCLPRSLDATAAGFHGGIWFAVQNESTVFGVVELLGTALGRGTRGSLIAVEQGGLDLGAVITRFSLHE